MLSMEWRGSSSISAAATQNRTSVNLPVRSDGSDSFTATLTELSSADSKLKLEAQAELMPPFAEYVTWQHRGRFPRSPSPAPYDIAPTRRHGAWATTAGSLPAGHNQLPDLRVVIGSVRLTPAPAGRRCSTIRHLWSFCHTASHDCGPARDCSCGDDPTIDCGLAAGGRRTGGATRHGGTAKSTAHINRDSWRRHSDRVCSAQRRPGGGHRKR